MQYAPRLNHKKRNFLERKINRKDISYDNAIQRQTILIDAHFLTFVNESKK